MLVDWSSIAARSWRALEMTAVPGLNGGLGGMGGGAGGSGGIGGLGGNVGGGNAGGWKVPVSHTLSTLHLQLQSTVLDPRKSSKPTKGTQLFCSLQKWHFKITSRCCVSAGIAKAAVVRPVYRWAPASSEDPSSSSIRPESSTTRRLQLS